jgi:hypothetical protein
MAALVSSAATADPAPQPQRPPSADLAKRCRELSIKAHPPTVAGSSKGDAGAERSYFAACIKKGGEPDR